MTPSELIGASQQHLVECLVGKKLFLVHPSAMQDLLRLKRAADDAGFDFCIASGFRDFERQKAIWNAKMQGARPVFDRDDQRVDISTLSEDEKVSLVLLWSALPGTSRHHWGCDFDFYDANVTSAAQPLQLNQQEYLVGPQASFYQWLKEYASAYGFFFPYDGQKSGYQFEPWHLSHRATWQSIKQTLNKSQMLDALTGQGILGEQSIVKRFDSIYTYYVMSVNEGDHDELFD
jgi:LAS superfamily LD-carboxypeptidase LdcB